MSFGDSSAVFEARALQMGMERAVLEKLQDKGYKTMALFAFSCNYAPGAASDRPLVDMVKDALGRDATALEMSIMRRLFSESYANVAADIKSQVEQTDETATRKLAPAERAERLREQQNRLKGLSIRGHYEPGDTLVDKFCNCYESDRLVYVEWSACISREFELSNNVKKDTSLSFSGDGTLKLSKHDKPDPAQTSSEIQVRYCLVRRGLAMEQANVMSYENHDRWTELLMETRMSEPPLGYQKVSMKQLEQADKKFFTLLSEHTRSGIKATPAGRPCDLSFDACFNATEVRHLLQPRMAQNAAIPNANPSGFKPNIVKEDDAFKRRKLGPKGKGGGKADTFQRVPVELLKLGGVASTSKGNRICFGFNLKTCNAQAKQQKCDRGLHLCCVKNCFKPHPAVECPTRQSKR